MFNYANNQGHTPIHIAVVVGSIAALELLLDHGADIHQVDNQGHTPIHIAVAVGNIAALEWLLAHGADIHRVDNEGYNCVYFAKQNENTQVLHWLYDHNVVDVDHSYCSVMSCLIPEFNFSNFDQYKMVPNGDKMESIGYLPQVNNVADINFDSVLPNASSVDANILLDQAGTKLNDLGFSISLMAVSSFIVE